MHRCVYILNSCKCVHIYAFKQETTIFYTKLLFLSLRMLVHIYIESSFGFLVCLLSVCLQSNTTFKT